jgi:DNA repair exonuclease SbcCD nuclease subunit
MKFVHAADIHLDSPMKGLRDYPGAPIDAIGELTRQAFESLIDLCLAEEIDLLLIAGDLYDGDWKDMKTGLYMRSQLQRLRDADIEVVLINGNHDAASVITRKLSLPGIHVLPAKEPTTLAFEELDVVVHGQSYPTRAVTENLAERYPDPVSGYFNIGLLHTALEGGFADHGNYAPCQLDQLVNHGYDYWALGHIHEPRVLHTDPHVVFAGVLQGRQIREAGPRGAFLVEVADGQATVEHRALDVMRWSRVTADAADADDEADLLESARCALEAAAESAENKLLAARLEIDGETVIHSLLVRDRERIEAELRALANEIGSERVWVERIIWSTETPRSSTVSDDAIGGALKAISDTAASQDALDGLAETLKPLAVKLPAEVKRGGDGIDPSNHDTLRRVLSDVARELPSLLTEKHAA